MMRYRRIPGLANRWMMIKITPNRLKQIVHEDLDRFIDDWIDHYNISDDFEYPLYMTKSDWLYEFLTFVQFPYPDYYQ